MGYRTSFKGHIEIVPALPQELVDSVNMLCNGRNNTFGDGDEYSFDAIIHHLRGWSKVSSGIHKDDISYFELKQFGVTKVPSNKCHWLLMNQKENLNVDNDDNENDQMTNNMKIKERIHQIVTVIKWNGEEEFYEYIYWMQYIVDFIALYSKYQFNIEITAFEGSIKMGRTEKDYGEIQIEPRILPERTGFYPNEFLPLPLPPHTTTHKKNRVGTYPYVLRKQKPVTVPPSFSFSSQEDHRSFKSLFGVKATVQYKDPLQICDLGNLRIDNGASRGGYVLLLKEQPNKKKYNQGGLVDDNCSYTTFYLHHEKSHVVYNEQDPKMKCSFSREEKLKLGSQVYLKWFITKAIAPELTAVTKRRELRKRKDFMDLTANMIVNLSHNMNHYQETNEKMSDTVTMPQAIVDKLNSHIEKLKLSIAYRKCTGCGSLFDGPAYQVV
ncbi:hypothetical protein INT45_006602 [Circinella minor]|uniref:Uncharacterized protein n=1 Tax=Circinella minor TaxID=1195481 RepID=A0A8H7VKA7_9FUNG|nr:hypothetical protein INT45_006602 [Circinella minor]